MSIVTGMTPSEIIADKGIKTIADKLGLVPNAVKQWKTRNNIPPKYWPQMSRAFPDLTVEKLEKVYLAKRAA